MVRLNHLKVEYYQYGGKNTDTVPAMLTPGEVVLNQDQQERLGNMLAGGGKVGGGQERAAALFKHIGVPGFQEGGVMTREELDKQTRKWVKSRTVPREMIERSIFYKDPKGYYDRGSDVLDITRNISKKESFLKDRPVPTEAIPSVGESKFQYKRQKDYYTQGAESAIKDFDWGKKDALMSYYLGGKVCGKKKK